MFMGRSEGDAPMIPGKGAIMKLCAFMIREAACLHEDEPITLNATPEVVRVMALKAKHERDALYDTVRELFDVCDRLMGDTDLPDDDSREMKAMQKAAKMINHRSNAFILGIDPHEQ